jgi:hypothetical protein
MGLAVEDATFAVERLPRSTLLPDSSVDNLTGIRLAFLLNRCYLGRIANARSFMGHLVNHED